MTKTRYHLRLDGACWSLDLFEGRCGLELIESRSRRRSRPRRACAAAVGD
jgi:CYTH domain-containing protein